MHRLKLVTMLVTVFIIVVTSGCGSSSEDKPSPPGPPPPPRIDKCVALMELGLLPAETEAQKEAVREAGGEHCLSG